MELEQATAIMREQGSWDWLLGGPAFISNKIATQELNDMGITVEQNSVTMWFGELKGTFTSGRERFAKRELVICMLAEKFGQSGRASRVG